MLSCSRGRVVKASDQKSDSLWERRFESYRLREHNFFHLIILFYDKKRLFWSKSRFCVCKTCFLVNTFSSTDQLFVLFYEKTTFFGRNIALEVSHIVYVKHRTLWCQVLPVGARVRASPMYIIKESILHRICNVKFCI